MSIHLARGLLVLLPVVFFHSILINPRHYIPWDLHGFHMPLADYIAWAVREGHWPWWDPNPYCGYPIHTDVQAQLFYPPAWLAILARNVSKPGTMMYWMQFEVVLHMMLAGLLTFAFARRLNATVPAALLGGVIYQLGAFFASQAQHLGAVCGSAWLPLAWMAVHELRERWRTDWFLALTAALALAFLAGFTATTLVVWSSTLLVALVLAPRRCWIVPLAMVATLPLIAAQLIPTWRWLEHTAASLRPDWNGGAGTPLRAWFGLLLPNWHGVYTPGDPSKFKDEVNFTFLYTYCGIAAIPALLLSIRWAPRWLALAVFFAVIQAGTNLPGWDAAYRYLPRLVKGAVYANFFLAAACLGIALAASLVYSKFQPAAIWALAILTAFDLTRAGSQREMNSQPGSWRWITSELRVNGNRDLVTTMERYTRAATPPLRTDTLDLDYHFTMNASLRRIPTANGDNPLAPLRLLELRRLFTSGNWWERQLPVTKPDHPLLDYLNVGYLIAEGSRENAAQLAAEGWQAREGGAWMRFYQNAAPQPRYFLVGRTHAVANGKESLARIEKIDLRQEALVEGAPVEATGTGTVVVDRHEPNSIHLTVDVTGPSFLVTSDSYHPDWHAFIDGKKTAARLTNHAFLGVAVPGGRHQVSLRYEPVALRSLSGMWTFAWLALAGRSGLLMVRAARRRSGKS